MEVKTCQEVCDVIIVGAGLSGLTSAYQILEKEHTMQIKIIEATSSIGGQMTQTRLGEVGGKWFSEQQVHIHKMIKEFQILVRHRRIMSPTCAKRCWDIDFGLFSPLVKFELFRYIKELELRVQFFRPGHYQPNKHDVTMKKHLQNRLFFTKSRLFIENFIMLVSGVDANKITFSQFMSNCYTCGGIKPLLDIFIYCPKRLLELPSSRLLNIFAEKLKPTEILFKRKVNEVHQFKQYVEVYDSENEVHKANVLILAIPWNSVKHIKFSPPMPPELDIKLEPTSEKVNNRLVVTSFIATYSDGHWRQKGYSGSLLLNEPLFLVGHEYNPYSYSGLLIHDEAIEPLIKSIALRKLADHFGEKMNQPNAYTQRTYEMSSIDYVPKTTPWKRIIFSSSSTAATCYRNCLGGAVQSGLRAAVNALLLLRPQTIIWQDIAELHRCDYLIRSDVSWFELWSSTWNLYNVTWYGLFAITMLSLLRQLQFKYNKMS